MKILQLVTKRQYRGAEVFAANLSEELIKRGHEIYFVGLYQNTQKVLTVEKAINWDLSSQKKNGLSLSLVSNLISFLNDKRPDIVQCNGSDTLKYMVTASGFTRRIPIVYRNISTISEWLNSSWKKRIYSQLFKRVDYVTSVGSESLNDLVETINFPKEKTAVIRRGIPLENFDPYESGKRLRSDLHLEDTDKVLIHVGNFSPEKNHVFLLELMEELKKVHPEIKLVCVGDGVTFSNIQQQVLEKKLEDTVFLLGFRSDIPQLLSGSDCFILSSLVEGVPGVILEAGVQRKPSIATNVGGVQEVIRDNHTGFIINHFNKKEFIKKIIEILENEELRNRLGENAFQLVSKEFDTKSNAERFESLYSSLIRKTPDNLKSPIQPEKLRVLQIIQKQQYRGAEIFSCQLSNHLLENGHDVKIFSIYPGTADLPYKNGIETFKRPKRGRLLDFKGWRAIAREIREYRPHLVQANASDTLKYTVLSKLYFGWKIPIVYRNASVTSFYIKNSFARKWNEELLKRVDKIISVSQWSRRDLNALFPFTLKKSEVITIGIEEAENVEANPFGNNQHRNIVHVGSLTREKNHEDLLFIFKNVRKKYPESRLHIIGEGNLKEEILINIKKLEIEDAVILYGEIKKPLNYIKFADVLVLTSEVEGLPAVILEAMYYETPVVAYSVGGINEILNDTTGFPVEFGNKEKFAASIAEIYDKYPLDKVSLAKEMISTNYLNKDIVKEFINSYYDVNQKTI